MSEPNQGISNELSNLNLDKKHFQKRHIFRRDHEPSRIPVRTLERLNNKSRKVRDFVGKCICSSNASLQIRIVKLRLGNTSFNPLIMRHFVKV